MFVPLSSAKSLSRTALPVCASISNVWGLPLFQVLANALFQGLIFASLKRLIFICSSRIISVYVTVHILVSHLGFSFCEFPLQTLFPLCDTLLTLIHVGFSHDPSRQESLAPYSLRPCSHLVSVSTSVCIPYQFPQLCAPPPHPRAPDIPNVTELPANCQVSSASSNSTGKPTLPSLSILIPKPKFSHQMATLFLSCTLFCFLCS